MVCPGPIWRANWMAPATLMPLEPPRHRPSCASRSNTTGNAYSSGTWKASSTGAVSRNAVHVGMAMASFGCI